MTNKTKLSKFSIAIRPDTHKLIMQLAQQENRSRSALIDVKMLEVCKKELIQPPKK